MTWHISDADVEKSYIFSFNAELKIPYDEHGVRTIAPEEICPGVRLGLGGGGQFSSGTIVLEPINTLF